MATKTTAPTSLANIGSAVGNIATQVQKGGMTQSQIDSAKSQLSNLSSQLQSGVSSGAYSRTADYAELDRPVAISKTAITPDAIKQPAPTLPTFNQTDYGAMGILNGLSQGILGDKAQVTTQAPQNDSLNAFLKAQEIIGKPPSTAELYEQARKETGILDKQKTVNDLTGQLNQITSQAQANQLSVTGQGRGIPEAIIGGQQAQIAKEAAIQALPISASLQAAQGNLQMAEQNLNTLFSIKSQDATNQYNYKKELVKGLYDIADKAQQRELDKIDKLETRKYNEGRDNLKYAQEISQMAIKTGQGDVARQIASLDQNSPTYMQEILSIQSKIKDPTLSLDIAIKNQQLLKLKKEIQEIGEPTKEEKKLAAQKLTEAKASIPIMKDKISEINSLFNHSGKDSRVGQNAIMRQGGGMFGVKNALTGSGNNFAATVHQLTSGLTLDNLISAKDRGATFGALSEGELRLLAQSATKLTNWEKKDSKGEGTGVWNIDQKSFDDELNKIKAATQRALILSGENLLDDEEDALMNKVFTNSQNMNLDVSKLY